MRTKTTLLLLLNGALLAAGASVWRDGQRAVAAPEHLEARQTTLPGLDVLQPPAAVPLDTAAIRDQAVFHASRAYYQPPTPAQVLQVPDYELAGVMKLPGGALVAFVKGRGGGAARTLHVGDDLEGWRVEALDSARVGLSHDSQHIDIAANPTTASTGLVRGPATPRLPPAGVRIIGGSGSAAVNVASTAPAAGVRIHQAAPPH